MQGEEILVTKQIILRVSYKSCKIPQEGLISVNC